MPVPPCKSDVSFVDLGDEPFVVGWPVMSTMAKKSHYGTKFSRSNLKCNARGWGTTRTRKLTFSSPGSNSMTKPGWAGTTMVVSSVFGLERNSGSLHPLGLLSNIRRMGLPEGFSGCSVRSRWGRVKTALTSCLVLRMQGCRKRREIGLG